MPALTKEQVKALIVCTQERYEQIENENRDELATATGCPTRLCGGRRLRRLPG
jgi:hypothetical protein